MSIRKTIGGDRLGSGNNMKAELDGYQRSTHDLGYVFKTTLSSGTLVPFLTELALPGDTFDINLGLTINTHPAIGPQFDTYKAQLDIFECPIRLYQAFLHNNAINIGMKMGTIKLPQIAFDVKPIPTADVSKVQDWDNYQVNPSCIMDYLGVKGFGTYIHGAGSSPVKQRKFNAIPLLGYWEIYKQYYSNKSEEIGAVIHTTLPDIVVPTTFSVSINPGTGAIAIPNINAGLVAVPWTTLAVITLNYTGADPIPSTVLFLTDQLGWISAGELASLFVDTGTAYVSLNNIYTQTLTIKAWKWRERFDTMPVKPQVVTFPLDNIDKMRMEVLKHDITQFVINDVGALEPYSYLWQVTTDGRNNTANTQEGLAIKTYQSDLFNNWISTEWIDGAGGIAEISAIDVSGGLLMMDSLALAKKVYNVLNRIAISGGTYDDWLDAVWATERMQRAETPIYHGGLSKELVFQEVVSNSQSDEGQPLGTLAGKGIMSSKHKGGQVSIKVQEPSYIIGIVSLTPRIGYSQGNKWDTHLDNMDELHKPEMDEIGYQELITEQMAAWDTRFDTVADTWITMSAGKQPAWMNYMTNVNRNHGNFAIKDNEMFMTLNRRYEIEIGDGDAPYIKDLTTYIDPTKYNYIFAETALDAQNFWVNIGVDMIARRKMSGKLIPNL